MTWVSDDPWGYVTFHFGRWGWSSAGLVLDARPLLQPCLGGLELVRRLLRRSR